MKYFSRIIVVLFSCLFLGHYSHSSPMRVFFELSPTIDTRICGESTMQSLSNLTQEAYVLLPEFQYEWDQFWANPLLSETIRIIGRPFSRKEKTALLMVCHKWKAIGTPLMLQFWTYLPSTRHFPQTTTLELPLHRSVFHTYLFHELLHPYIYEIIPFNQPTPLKERFKNEPINIQSRGLVIAHIHLMALQKKVLLNLGLVDAYRRQREVDQLRSLASGEYLLPAYKRAWEIVDLVGEDALIQELINNRFSY